jgi:hypothetical protein
MLRYKFLVYLFLIVITLIILFVVFIIVLFFFALSRLRGYMMLLLLWYRVKNNFFRGCDFVLLLFFRGEFQPIKEISIWCLIVAG